MMLNASQWTGLMSAMFGAAGTIVLFLSSYSLQPFEGATFGGPETNAENAKIRVANAKRVRNQRYGLVLLLCSFVLAGASVLLS